MYLIIWSEVYYHRQQFSLWPSSKTFPVPNQFVFIEDLIKLLKWVQRHFKCINSTDGYKAAMHLEPDFVSHSSPSVHIQFNLWIIIDRWNLYSNLKKQEGLNVIYAQIYLKIKTEKCTQVIINFSNDISKSIIVIRMICQ